MSDEGIEPDSELTRDGLGLLRRRKQLLHGVCDRVETQLNAVRSAWLLAEAHGRILAVAAGAGQVEALAVGRVAVNILAGRIGGEMTGERAAAWIEIEEIRIDRGEPVDLARRRRNAHRARDVEQ